MNKTALLQKIIAHLDGELALYAKAARAAHAEATHEQSRAENKYDTRGLEASYLARGQSRQAAEIARAREEFARMEPRRFGLKDPIDVGALVELDGSGERAFYFVGPCSGGTEVTQEKKTVLVITLQSPLGSQLAGRREGETLKLEIGGSKSGYLIVSVK